MTETPDLNGHLSLDVIIAALACHRFQLHSAATTIAASAFTATASAMPSSDLAFAEPLQGLASTAGGSMRQP